MLAGKLMTPFNDLEELRSADFLSDLALGNGLVQTVSRRVRLMPF
jgi:hypothetical protein